MGEHNGALAHQFEDLGQQYEAGRFGMWIFLVTEIMFFGGLITGYVIYRTTYPDAWAAGSRTNDVWLGLFMTIILLGSSLTMALAVRSAQLGARRLNEMVLGLTILLGLIFMGMKGFEYYNHFHHGLIPGHDFSGYSGPNADQVQLFVSFYFAMTGVHALHMVVGVGLLAFLWWMSRRGRFTTEYYSPVELTGLYWHFVDIVWIFLFPMLYLVDLHK